MGLKVETDANGYLLDWTQWSRQVASDLAAKDHFELTSDHWEVIDILRVYYKEYEIAPPVRALVKLVQKKLGGPHSSSRQLYRLFPDGPAKQACRYAGLPKPVSCI
jgi:TusE/DsrC/DsvC family sulfur relay protein